MFATDHAGLDLAEARAGEIPAPDSFKSAAEALRYLNRHGTLGNAGGVPVLIRGDGLPTPQAHLAIVRHWRDDLLELQRRGVR